MVTEWGMSDKLGPIAHITENASFLGPSFENKSYSNETAQHIDLEVQTIIETQYARVKSILETHRQNMHRVVDVLLERETLTGEEFQMVLDGQTLPPNEDSPAPKREPEKDDERPKPPTVLRPSRT
jgi:cell division protease FtsH